MERDQVKYGCHCDLEPGQQPDGCMLDGGDYEDCIYAKKGMKKEDCKHWKPIEAVKSEKPAAGPWCRDLENAPELSQLIYLVRDAAGRFITSESHMLSDDNEIIAYAVCNTDLPDLPD